MAHLFDLDSIPEEISILDPGAGSGILTAALLERIEATKKLKKVEVVCYENNETVLAILKKNLEMLKRECSFDMKYKIEEVDYLVSQSNDFESTLLANNNPKKFHIIIANPPYLSVLKDNVAALANYVKSILTPEEKKDILEYRRYNNYVMFNCPKTTQGVRSFLPVKGEENMVVRYVKSVFGCTSEEAKNALDLVFNLLVQASELAGSEKILHKHEKKRCISDRCKQICD